MRNNKYNDVDMFRAFTTGLFFGGAIVFIVCLILNNS